MSRAYEYWIHQQLEPNDIIITGSKQKRSYSPLVPVLKPPVQKDDKKIEREYLKSKGIEFPN